MMTTFRYGSGWLRAGLLLLALLTLSCGEGKVIPAAGPYSDVLMITETGRHTPLVRAFIEQLSEPVLWAFESENEFNVYLAPESALPGNSDVKNLLLVVRTDRRGGLLSRVRRILGPDLVRLAKAEGRKVFYRQDLFSRGQDVYIVLMEGAGEEEYVLTRMGPTIRRRLRVSTRDRYRDYLLRGRENRAGAKYLSRQYGFSLRYPSEYHLLQEKPEIPALELHRKDPSRAIGLFWRNAEKQAPALADSVALLAFREEAIGELYPGDWVLREDTWFEDSQLGDYEAVRMQGIWQNDEDMTGGAFVTYFLHDERRNRLMAIDLLLYAPGLEKNPYFRELEALASTLRF